ncbi:MAG TPA: hypothetical protein VH391_06380 [Solirubrobacterales bacterium]
MNAARIAYGANWVFMSRRRGSTLFPRSAAKTRRRFAESGIGEPHYVTAVVRPPQGVAERLFEAASRLDGTQPGHYLYPRESIHLTVLGLADRVGIEEEVRDVAKGSLPFGVEVGGLNLSAETVFAELYPVGSGLLELREGLRSLESHEHGTISRWIRRRIAHANLIRFRAPIDAGMVAEVGRMRRASFGEFEVEEVELVHTDKVMSSEGTRTLARCPLQLG